MMVKHSIAVMATASQLAAIARAGDPCAGT